MKTVLLLYFLGTFVSWPQNQSLVDFTKIQAVVYPDMEKKEVSGEVRYEFQLLQPTDSIYIDAIDMKFSNVRLDGEKARFSNDKKHLAIKAPKQLGNHIVTLSYSCRPKRTVYFIDNAKEREPQVWTQGQGKYTSNWLPSFDEMTEKTELDLTFKTSVEQTVIANGKLTKAESVGGFKYSTFDMQRPMSSYLAAFVIGSFEKKVMKSKSGISIELYHEPKDSLRFEPTYRYSKEIFDFLEEEIGVTYPWQNYKQVPVRDFLYAGMENTSCTIFSDQYVIDSTAFVDKNYVNVNAHELAHQWFGNLVTEVNGEHHWLHEGFATYYAYLAERDLFGEDYYYWKLYDTARTLKRVADNNEGEALTDPKASSLTFYEKGAWALVILRERIGDDAFRVAIGAYLKKYAFGNATIDDFMEEAERCSGKDLTDFKGQWLENEQFPWKEAKDYLTKNSSVSTFLAIKEFNKTGRKQTEPDMNKKVWTSTAPEELKIHYVTEFVGEIPDSTLYKLIEQEPLRVRQAIAMSKPEISEPLRTVFESMLQDNSYMTQETVLFKLWQAFPNRRSNYLDALNGVVGLPNKNVRQLWLVLALLTPEYQPNNKKRFYDELNGYTNTGFNFEIRQLAFQYLFQIKALSDGALINLFRAADHHVWQFKKSSRNLLRELYKTDEGRQRLNALKPRLSAQLKTVWELILNPK